MTSFNRSIFSVSQPATMSGRIKRAAAITAEDNIRQNCSIINPRGWEEIMKRPREDSDVVERPHKKRPLSTVIVDGDSDAVQRPRKRTRIRLAWQRIKRAAAAVLAESKIKQVLEELMKQKTLSSFTVSDFNNGFESLAASDDGSISSCTRAGVLKALSVEKAPPPPIQLPRPPPPPMHLPRPPLPPIHLPPPHHSHHPHQVSQHPPQPQPPPPLFFSPPVILQASLHNWYEAIKKLPNKETFLRPSDNQKFLAWLGDKMLGAEAAYVVRNSTNIRTAGGATKLINTALSNRFFASNILTFFPKHICPTPTGGVHSIGTVLEAAVAEVVHTENGMTAVRELTEWIIKKAKTRLGL